jgi:hypothetical protein
MTDGPALVPQWQHINDLLENAKMAPSRVFDAVDYSVIDETSSLLGALSKELHEAHRIISIYWEAVDLLNDCRDDEDQAHAENLITGVQITASGIAEAYRIRQALIRDTSAGLTEVSKPVDVSATAWVEAINSGASTQSEIEARARKNPA